MKDEAHFTEQVTFKITKAQKKLLEERGHEHGMSGNKLARVYAISGMTGEMMEIRERLENLESEHQRLKLSLREVFTLLLVNLIEDLSPEEARAKVTKAMGQAK